MSRRKRQKDNQPSKPAPTVVEREVVFMSDMKPPRREYRDLPLYGQQNWESVDAVRAALTQLDIGLFAQASMMVDAMMADDRISGVWSCRADGLVGLPLEFFVPQGMEADEKAIEVAKDAEKAWPRMAPEQALTDLLRWGRFLGIGVAEKLYDIGSWTPRLKVWHPRFLYWNWGTRTYHLITEDGVLNLDHNDPAVLRKWVFYAPYGFQRGWVNARVRALAIPWLIRQWTWRDHARHNEVHGIPIRKLKVPAQWDPEDKNRALAEIGQLATESVVRCPVNEDGNGFDLELVEPTSNSWEAFTSLQARADTAIAVVLLGQNLTTEIADKGSRAAAQVHDRVRQDVIRSDSDTLGRCMRDSVLADWAEFNHGAREMAPTPSWDIVPPRDELQLGNALSATAQAIQTFRESGLPVDFKKLCRDVGIPLEEGKEIPEYEDPALAVEKVRGDNAVKVAKSKPKPKPVAKKKSAAA